MNVNVVMGFQNIIALIISTISKSYITYYAATRITLTIVLKVSYN